MLYLCKMNKKNLDIVLKVLQKEYPFIIGVEYCNKQSLGLGFDPLDHNFKFSVDMETFKSLYPNLTVDSNFLNEVHYCFHIPTSIFEDYDGDVSDYGMSIYDITSTLLSTIVPNNELYNFGYRFVINN